MSDMVDWNFWGLILILAAIVAFAVLVMLSPDS